MCSGLGLTTEAYTLFGETLRPIRDPEALKPFLIPRLTPSHSQFVPCRGLAQGFGAVSDFLCGFLQGNERLGKKALNPSPLAPFLHALLTLRQFLGHGITPSVASGRDCQGEPYTSGRV